MATGYVPGWRMSRAVGDGCRRPGSRAPFGHREAERQVKSELEGMKPEEEPSAEEVIDDIEKDAIID